jgi:hypothetical protein
MSLHAAHRHTCKGREAGRRLDADDALDDGSGRITAVPRNLRDSPTATDIVAFKVASSAACMLLPLV